MSKLSNYHLIKLLLITAISQRGNVCQWGFRVTEAGFNIVRLLM